VTAGQNACRRIWKIGVRQPLFRPAGHCFENFSLRAFRARHQTGGSHSISAVVDQELCQGKEVVERTIDHNRESIEQHVRKNDMLVQQILRSTSSCQVRYRRTACCLRIGGTRPTAVPDNLCSALCFLHKQPTNLPIHTFPLVLRSDSRLNIPREFLRRLYELAPGFEALSRPWGIRDSRGSLIVE